MVWMNGLVVNVLALSTQLCGFVLGLSHLASMMLGKSFSFSFPWLSHLHWRVKKCFHNTLWDFTVQNEMWSFLPIEPLWNPSWILCGEHHQRVINWILLYSLCFRCKIALLNYSWLRIKMLLMASMFSFLISLPSLEGQSYFRSDGRPDDICN